MKINPDDPKWTAYVLGELDADELTEMETLLASSEEARRLVEELRIATIMLKDEFTSQESVALLSEQRVAVVRASQGDSRRQWSVFRPLNWAVGFAAAILIVLAVVVPLRRQEVQVAENRAENRKEGVETPSGEALDKKLEK